MRPTGVVSRGELFLGLEVEIDDGAITRIGPHTGVPEPFVLSAAFVNGHSHLEYRNQQDKVQAAAYWDWLFELTGRKPHESLEEVRHWTHVAADENRLTGVGLIAEHADRPVVGKALADAGLRGRIYQEVLTAGEPDVAAKLEAVRRRAEENADAFEGETLMNPHAPWTVDVDTLSSFGHGPISIHVAESDLERPCFVAGEGPMADAMRRWMPDYSFPGETSIRMLARLGLARPGAQFVHCCDLDAEEVQILAQTGVSVAHCPRSNARLRCPTSPVRELLDAGVPVAIGMDSPASGGPIDIFAEMRSALDRSIGRGKPLTAEEIWSAATWMGARSIGFGGWDVEIGSRAPLIKLNLPGAHCTEDLLTMGSPACVEWLEP